MALEPLEPPLDGPLTPAESFWNWIREAIRSHPVSLEDIANTLEVWEQLIRQDLPAWRRLLPSHTKQLLDGITLTRSRLTYEWLCPNMADLTTMAPPARGAEAQLRALSWEHWTCCSPPTAGPLIQQPVVVHLYSGRRRPGGLQACIEELSWPAEAWKPIVISLDVVLDATWGNVLSPQAQKFWLAQISKGAVHGMIAGPPCETWSVARQRYYQTLTGPRPVRDLESLWGLKSLSLSEALQVLTADKLLTFPLAAFLRMWFLRRWFVLEHPSPPDRTRHPAAPSIWELYLVQILGSLVGVEMQEIYQGYLGAPSPKPTMLMKCHGEPILDSMRRHHVRADLPAPLKMGFEADSRFYATAKLKEYPTGMNRGLADNFLSWFQSSARESDPVPYEPSQLEIFQLFLSKIGDGEIGPDYACPA